jgi:hypothetical protein
MHGIGIQCTMCKCLLWPLYRTQRHDGQTDRHDHMLGGGSGSVGWCPMEDVWT